MKRFLILLIISVSALCVIIFASCADKTYKTEDGLNNDSVNYSAEVYDEDGNVLINETNFPDAVFREWLEDQANVNGYGSDGVFTAEELAQIKEITIRGTSDRYIRDLKGIEFFTELTNLSVPYNALTSLSFTGNSNITYLNCSYNKLTHLDVSSLTSLKTLYCEFNYLKQLDLTYNTQLTVLYSRHNVLEKLDLKNNTKLVFIETFDNMLTEIDVSMLKDLEFLHIDHNKLTELDLSQNLNLKGGGFVCRNNDVRRIILPVIDEFTVYYDDFAEQDPITGYERSEWYEDKDFTIPVTSDVEAEGQTLYAKRIANSYTVNFEADGATGVPSSVKTYYDSDFDIPSSVPSKKGYEFVCWSDDKYYEGTSYTSGQSVKNLAGDRYDGEKITLYAKWKGIEYIVSFDKNSQSATGEMSDVRAVYGSSFILPHNAFLMNGYDFAGWATEKDGDVVYADGQSVSDLASSEGQTVTLYAVWKEKSSSMSQPYIDSLRQTLETLYLSDYYSEDKDSLNSIYNAALASVNAATDKTVMQNITQNAINEMNSVPTVQTRVSQIVETWKIKHSSALSLITVYPIESGYADIYLTQVSAALNDADMQTLSSFCSLKNSADKNDAAERAILLIQSEITQCSDFVSAAQWITEAEEFTSIPLSEVMPKNEETCGILTDRYFGFSEQEKKYIKSETADSLIAVRELAASKNKGIEEISYLTEKTQGSDLSAETLEKINAVISEVTSLVLSSENDSQISSYIKSASQHIDDIIKEQETAEPEDPDQPEKPQPNPDTPDDPEQEDPQPPEQPEDIKDKDMRTAVIAVTAASSSIAVVMIIITVCMFIKKRKTNKNQ